MRKFPVVCAFALLLVNPCLSIAAITESTKTSTFCRNELQKTSYDRISSLDNELFPMISKGQVEQSITQINRIIDIAFKSKDKSLSYYLERLLGDDLFWRQDYHVARLIKVTPTAKRSLILGMLDNISGRIQSLDASYSSLKIQNFVKLANIYHGLNVKDKPSILLNQALQMSSGVRLTEMRTNLLTRIARTYLDIGQPTLAQKTLAQSYQVAQQFDKETKDKQRSFHPSSFIALIYAELGNFDRALDVAKSIPNRHKKAETLVGIGSQYIKINQLEQAQKLIPAIVNEREKVQLLGQLASAYASAKNLDVADQLFNQAVKTAIPSSNRDSLLEPLITSYAQAGQVNAASQTIELIQDIRTKVNAHLAIASEYRKRNQLAENARSVEAMVTLTQQQDIMSIQSSIQTAIETGNVSDYHSLFNPLLIKLKQRPESLGYLGQVALRHNQIDFAYLTVQTIDNPDSHEKNRLLSRIAVAYAKAKQPDKAKQAALTANSVSIMPYQVYALAQIATAFQKNGQTIADTTLNQAIQNANALSDTKLRAVALTIIAREYNSQGQKQLGQQFLTQAIQTAKSVVTLSDKEKTEFTNLIYNILWETKQFEQALQVTSEIYETQPNKANYSSIVIGSLQAGQDDLALKAVQLETNKNVKTRGLINIAKAKILGQQKSKAINTLAQAVLVAKTIPQDSARKVEDTESKASLLEEIALLYAQIGQDKEALQVAMIQDASEVDRVKQRISCY